MALLLDTDQVDPRDRADVVAAAVQGASAPAHIVHNSADSEARARFDSWQFGEFRLQRSLLSGFKMVRTPKQIRNSPGSALIVSVPLRSTSRLIQADTQHEIGPDQLMLIDLDAPFELDWRCGPVLSLFVPRDKLDLSGDTIRAALNQPQRSPLHRLVARHIVLTAESADPLESDPGAPVLGDACAEMVRALLISTAAYGGEDGTVLPADILLSQISDYVHRRLSDPDLSPAGIARAHHISMRHLYKVCARAGLSLEQWIITQRLERARSDLARLDTRDHSIAAIANRHGFRHPSHFTRRFRAAYGVTPNAWRREALERSSDTMRSSSKVVGASSGEFGGARHSRNPLATRSSMWS
ncbi:helix-turn-helix domain-containing protein [Nocardia suismassiliense]|uniref:helix-turn-helix domain-containing protein n=1 Tax=Nocardia suismassiliense TaxID=2077092 RepID=UPI000D1F0B3B|nr:helix-turn-helix domain-containing protein [Nocardia suismassiliense]